MNEWEIKRELDLQKRLSVDELERKCELWKFCHEIDKLLKDGEK